MKPKLLFIYSFYVLRIIFCMPVLPVIYFLGKSIKASIPDLPEASRNIEGKVGDSANLKRILLVGESSISGVGIDDHALGIPGEIGRSLFSKKEISIKWQVIAKSGYKAIDVIDQLTPQLPDEEFDLLILGLGGNDTFQQTPPWVWRKHMATLINLLKNKYPKTHVVISAMPPVADFPVFPLLLQSFMGGHINMLRHTIMDFPLRFSQVSYLSDKVKMQEWLGEDTTDNIQDFFSDGVHPSEITYQLIGKAIAGKIEEHNILKT